MKGLLNPLFFGTQFGTIGLYIVVCRNCATIAT